MLKSKGFHLYLKDFQNQVNVIVSIQVIIDPRSCYYLSGHTVVLMKWEIV
jgi:hypothetical protein